MYLEPIRAVGLPAGYQMQYSLTGASRMIKTAPKKRNTLTADQIIAHNAFLAKVAANKAKSKKPSQSMFAPMAVRFR